MRVDLNFAGATIERRAVRRTRVSAGMPLLSEHTFKRVGCGDRRNCIHRQRQQERRDKHNPQSTVSRREVIAQSESLARADNAAAHQKSAEGKKTMTARAPRLVPA